MMNKRLYRYTAAKNMLHQSLVGMDVHIENNVGPGHRESDLQGLASSSAISDRGGPVAGDFPVSVQSRNGT
jgi:hypothetical protein